MRRRARPRRRVSTEESSHSTTVLAPISMRLSSPKAAGATDRARSAAQPRTTIPATFETNVVRSRRTPRGCRPGSRASILICMATQIREDPTDEQVGLAVETFKLLADGTRLRVLWALLH